jgi:single-strand DNA-binding protein
MSVNKVILIGNCGNDPEIRTTQDGREIANFSIGITETWKDKNSGEKKSRTEWVNISAFGGIVSIIKNYVRKGSKVYVEGALETSKYQKDGKDVYSTKVVLKGFNSTLQLLSKNEKEGESISQHSVDKANAYQPQEESDDSISDEIPF